MENIKEIMDRRSPNVYVDKDIYNNVYDENVASKIKDAIDKPKAIGQILVEKLDAPNNLRLYIKLAYQYPIEFLFLCVALTEEAYKDGLIRTTKSQYFYGIVKQKKKL